MDLLLDSTGDLYISSKGDVILKNSVAQKIRIKLLWLEGEWKWNKEEGIPYRESLFIKNPDTDYFAGIVRQKIFEVTHNQSPFRMLNLMIFYFAADSRFLRV